MGIRLLDPGRGDVRPVKGIAGRPPGIIDGGDNRFAAYPLAGVGEADPLLGAGELGITAGGDSR